MIQIVVRAIIAQEDKLLLVRNKSTDFWCLPGGKVDEDEQIIPALKREITEELGVEPVLGKLLYVQQLFLPTEQRLEFLFAVENSADYANLDLTKTTHGELELDDAGFYDPQKLKVLPSFLTEFRQDMSKDLPLFKVESKV
ncbi:MAG: NUDIX hydrolase [Candidatus Saccharimonadales bacterium]